MLSTASLVPRGRKYRGISLERQLDVYGTTLDRRNRFRLYRLASWTMRFTGTDLHDTPAASFSKVAAEVHNPWLLAFYIVGLIAASWHFAYGIWLFAAKWGIVSGDKAQQRLLKVCLAFFLLLTVVGLTSLYTFRERFQDVPGASGNIVDSRHALTDGRPVH